MPVGADPPLPLPQLTFVDFLAYDVLDQQRLFVPDCPELKGNLAQFLQRFEVSRARDSPRPTPEATPVSPAPSPALTPQWLCPCPIPSLIFKSPVFVSPSPFLSPL